MAMVALLMQPARSMALTYDTPPPPLPLSPFSLLEGQSRCGTAANSVNFTAECPCPAVTVHPPGQIASRH